MSSRPENSSREKSVPDVTQKHPHADSAQAQFSETDQHTPRRRGRPPKQERSQSDTRALLIQNGTAVLTEYGFTSTGIDGILKLAGVPKGSFYYYFESKEAFGLAILDNYRRYFAYKLDKTLNQDGVPPLERIPAYVADAKRGMIKFNFRRGCLVGNLNQEVAGLPDSFRQVLMDILAEWQQQLAACLHQAQQDGTLDAQADCDQLAEYFWIGWEGAVMRARLVESTAPLDLFLNLFMAQLPRAKII